MIEKRNATGDPKEKREKSKMNLIQKRNFFGFWLLGLTNNFAYVVMLSGAHDILSGDKHKIETPKDVCNPMSTGVILILDIIPALFIKLFAPFFLGFTSVKVLINVALTIASFLLVGLELNQYFAYTGVILASLASGLGEITFLGYMSRYQASSISAWSSGTGAAGFFGSLSYFGLTYIGLTSKQSILIMLIMPFLMLVSYFLIIIKEDETLTLLGNETGLMQQQSSAKEIKDVKLSLSVKFKLIRNLSKYMIPIGLVYLFEYFINQGLSELIYFKSSAFNHEEQYRFYQAEYQLGVLISRSSIGLFQIDKIWVLAVLQALNVFIFLSHILHPFLTSFWMASCIILFEGLLGGAAYVNTFHKLKMNDEFNENEKEFSMSVTSLADTIGISISAFTAIPVHNILCDYMKKHY